MSLSTKVMAAMKEAMKAKDQNALTSLRAVKSAILLAQTETGSKQELTEAQELHILQKQVKQRKDSAAIFTEQGRSDLAEPELAQAEVIAQFLPAQMSEDEIAEVVDEVISNTGAQGMKDMGKVMGVVNGKLAGRADGKTISGIVKARLMQ
ncbi:MAG: glutamyl-tRNA amidotransferase [Cytophagaceae bacterium]|nr:glutamyl-tRNA amidotransferase [Cytophagaceae bacterium]